jgi:hypothetical protein
MLAPSLSYACSARAHEGFVTAEILDAGENDGANDVVRIGRVAHYGTLILADDQEFRFGGV